jgi:hypothetical protein
MAAVGHFEPRRHDRRPDAGDDQVCQARSGRFTVARGSLITMRVANALTRLVAVAGLAVDSYVHFDLAGIYSETGGVITEGVLFRAEAVVALSSHVTWTLEQSVRFLTSLTRFGSRKRSSPRSAKARLVSLLLLVSRCTGIPGKPGPARVPVKNG